MTLQAIPHRLNLAIAAALLALHALALLALPLVLLPRSPWWGLALLLPVAATPTLWALIHEAIHGSLHPDRAWNDRAGRLLAGVFGSPFQILRLGHLMHHRFNRSALNRADVARGAPPGLAERAAYFGRLLGGLYLGELAASLLAVVPRRARRALLRIAFGDALEDGRSMWPAAERQLLAEPGRTRLQREGIAGIAGLALALLAFGADAWMLALAIVGRALVVSALDDVYHYGNHLDEVLAGSDLRLPRPLRWWFLNFNLHGTHHQRPNLPWTALPDAFRALQRHYAGDLGPAVVRQLSGPIPEAAYRAREARDAAPRAQGLGKPRRAGAARAHPLLISAARAGSPRGAGD